MGFSLSEIVLAPLSYTLIAIQNATWKQRAGIFLAVVVVIALFVRMGKGSAIDKYDMYLNSQVQGTLPLSGGSGSENECAKVCNEVSECLGFDYNTITKGCFYKGGRVGSRATVLPLPATVSGIVAYVKK